MIHKISTGQQGFLGLGVHNPVIHTATVTIAWIKLFKKLPSLKEFICIFFHDFGYINWNDEKSFVDNHPELGAKICGFLLGKYGYEMCIAHSRDYAIKKGLKLSKLCYADKASNLVLPLPLYKLLLVIGGTYRWAYTNYGRKDTFVSLDLTEIVAHYQKWVAVNYKGLFIAQQRKGEIRNGDIDR